MDLEIRHLRMICAIADTGSVTKAASALGLAQPALTAALQRVERSLGGALFERDRRGARPTVLGELVLARARVLLPAVRDLTHEAARLVGAEAAAASYRIGAVNGPILGGLVRRLAADHPEAAISTQASWSADELMRMVSVGRLDYALVGMCGDATPSAEHGLAWHVVAVDPVCVLLPERHPLAGNEEIDLADLGDAQWAATPGDGCMADCFAATCARAGFTPRRIYETDVGGCIDLVQSGVAVALCQPQFRLVPGLVALPIAGAPLRWRHLLGWHPDGPLAGRVGQVSAHASAAYAEAVARTRWYADWLGSNPRFGSADLG